MNIYRLKGASGKVAGKNHTLGTVTVLGRDTACDLVINDEQLAGRQAEIRLETSGSLRLVQLDAAHDVLVNGQPVTDQLLNSGDEIRIGTCRWVLQAPGLRPEKVLTDQAVKRRSSALPWLLLAALLAAAALAWQKGWLPF